MLVARAAFDPVLFSNALVESVDEPRRVPVLGGILLGSPESKNDHARLEAGVRKLLAVGRDRRGRGLRGPLRRHDTDGIAFSPDPAWNTGLSLTVTQPLLRGFGSEVTLADVALTQNQLRRSQYGLKSDLQTVVATVEQAYRDLQAGLAAALDPAAPDRAGRGGRARARASAAASTRRRRSYSDAQATVERRRADLVRARRAVTAASDRLKALMNDPELSVDSELLLEPDSDLEVEPERFQLRQAVAAALENRPEVQRALLDIEDADLRQRVAANQRRAQLDLSAGAAVTGLDDQLGSSAGDLTDEDFNNLFLGLTFELPIGNRAAAAAERQARIQSRAAVLAYEQAVQDVIVQVKDALRAVQATYELIGAARSSRVAESENLRALLAEAETRSSFTPEFLNLEFQRQDRLAAAQIQEVQAITDYRRALALYLLALGRGLEEHGIQVEEPDRGGG